MIPILKTKDVFEKSRQEKCKNVLYLARSVIYLFSF